MRNGTGLRLGFVILAWNSEKVIGPCLESIFAMKGIESHVVVVDNGSTDDTLARVDAAWAKFSGDPGGSTLEIIRLTENQGTTVPRNLALRVLMAENMDYYCVLDSDTVVNEAAFVVMARELDAHPGYGMIGPTLISSAGVRQMSARNFPTAVVKLLKAAPLAALQRLGERMEQPRPAGAGANSYPVDCLMSACWLIRPEALAAAGLLDERIFYAPEDVEYCIRMWKSGNQVAFCPGARIIHEWQRLSKKRFFSRINWEHIKGLAYMFAKHRYLFGTRRLKHSFPSAAGVAPTEDIGNVAEDQ